MPHDTARSGRPSRWYTTGAGSEETGPRVASWRTAIGSITLDRPRIAGILNVTPDSFWDGGRHTGAEAALRRAGTLVHEGADVLDIGGESTRPGARTVPVDRELERVVPVVRACAREWPEVAVSVDTVKAVVAAAALDEGAAIINDVSGFRLDADMAAVCARAGAGVVLMHSRGGVNEMAGYDMAAYGRDPVGDIIDELGGSVSVARTGGVSADAIVLDPGLGFSKRTPESVAVLRELDRFLALGFPVMLGPSRKRFLGELAGGLPAELRLPGTVAACVIGWLAGARLFRVHDVGPVRNALDVAAAVTD